MQKIKQIIMSSLVILSFLVAPLLLNTIVASAQQEVKYNPSNSATCGANGEAVTNAVNNATCEVNSEEGKTLPQIVAFIINVFSWIIGAVSVIMIIYGGFRYITSGGDSNGVTAAKNTILYASIGLIIVALAQIIVNFVLDKTTNIGTS